MKKEAILVLLIVLASLTFVSAEHLEISSSSLKTSLKINNQETKSLSIASEEGGEFSLEISDLPGIVLSGEHFVLGANEKRKVEVNFDSTGVTPGIYVGNIKIRSTKETLVIPVIFEVESANVFFDANLDIPPVYTEISQGEKVVSQVKVFDLTSGGTQEGVGAVSVDLEYKVFDLDGKVLSLEAESLVIDGQTQITKTIGFPENVATGNYVLGVVVDYKSSIGASSQSFAIIESTGGGGSGGGLNFSDYNMLIIIIIGAVLFLVIVFLFVYLLRDRDKILVELRRYNAQEMRNVRKILEEQRMILSKGKKIKGMKKELDVREEIERKLGKLKEKQKVRVKEIKRLEKSGEVEQMKRKLREWKSKGYNTLPMEYKIGGLSNAQMRSVMHKWKKEYSPKRTKTKELKR